MGLRVPQQRAPCRRRSGGPCGTRSEGRDMPRPRTISMKATNLALDIMARMPVGAVLPAENALAQQVGVSRTAMRSALLNLENGGLIGRRGRLILVRRRPRKGDYFAADQTETRSGLVERRFLEMAVSGDLMPRTELLGGGACAPHRREHRQRQGVPVRLLALWPGREVTRPRLAALRVRRSLRARACEHAANLRAERRADVSGCARR